MNKLTNLIKNLILDNNENFDKFVNELNMIDIILKPIENYNNRLYKIDLDRSEITMHTPIYLLDLTDSIKRFTITKVNRYYILKIDEF